MHLSFTQMLVRYVYLTAYGFVKYIPTPLGDVLRLVVLLPFVRKLKTFWIHEGVTLHWPGRISVGKGCTLNEFVTISGIGDVVLGDYVMIAAGVKIFSGDHEMKGTRVAPYHQPIVKKPVVIEDGVYLGAGAMVLGGVTIGKGAVIGAGAVVTRSIPPMAVAMGVPARVCRYRTDESEPCTMK